MFILLIALVITHKAHVFHVIMATTHPNSTTATHAIVPVKLALTPYPATPVNYLHHLVSHHNFALVHPPHLMME
jgi:hypothetical protein